MAHASPRLVILRCTEVTSPLTVTVEPQSSCGKCMAKGYCLCPRATPSPTSSPFPIASKRPSKPAPAIAIVCGSLWFVTLPRDFEAEGRE